MLRSLEKIRTDFWSHIQYLWNFSTDPNRQRTWGWTALPNSTRGVSFHLKSRDYRTAWDQQLGSAIHHPAWHRTTAGHSIPVSLSSFLHYNHTSLPPFFLHLVWTNEPLGSRVTVGALLSVRQRPDDSSIVPLLSSYLFLSWWTLIKLGDITSPLLLFHSNSSSCMTSLSRLWFSLPLYTQSPRPLFPGIINDITRSNLVIY